MKKIVVILIMVAGSFFIGCFGDDGDSCDPSSNACLNYTNSQSDTGAYVQNIQWIANASTNQTWSGQLSQGSTSDSKEVTVFTGQSEAIGEDSATYQLEFLENGIPAQTMNLTQGANNNWNISSAQMK